MTIIKKYGLTFIIDGCDVECVELKSKRSIPGYFSGFGVEIFFYNTRVNDLNLLSFLESQQNKIELLEQKIQLLEQVEAKPVRKI